MKNTDKKKGCRTKKRSKKKEMDVKTVVWLQKPAAELEWRCIVLLFMQPHLKI